MCLEISRQIYKGHKTTQQFAIFREVHMTLHPKIKYFKK